MKSFHSFIVRRKKEKKKIYCFSQTNIGTFFRGQQFLLQKHSRLCRSIVNKKYPKSFPLLETKCDFRCTRGTVDLAIRRKRRRKQIQT